MKHEKTLLRLYLHIVKLKMRTNWNDLPRSYAPYAKFVAVLEVKASLDAKETKKSTKLTFSRNLKLTVTSYLSPSFDVQNVFS